MSEHNPYPNESDLNVRKMVGDPVALAWCWLLAYCENINEMIGTDHDEDSYYDSAPITIDELINTAMSHVGEGDPWGDYITRGGTFEGFGMDPTFWDKLADLKQIEIPHNQRGGIFSCSC